MVIPDYSNQEEMIHIIGDCEYLTKAGKKILRFKKTTWGNESDTQVYNLIKPYLVGSILNIGLGFGNSVKTALQNQNITSIKVYDLEQDIIDMFYYINGEDERIEVINNDAHQFKPNGNFDCILYELEFCSQNLYNEAKSYVEWSINHLNEGGIIITKYCNESVGLITEFSSELNAVTLSLTTGRKPDPKWIIFSKE